MHKHIVTQYSPRRPKVTQSKKCDFAIPRFAGTPLSTPPKHPV